VVRARPPHDYLLRRQNLVRANFDESKNKQIFQGTDFSLKKHVFVVNYQ